MRELRARFFMVVGLSVMLAAFAVLLTIPHRTTKHPYTVRETSHGISEAAGGDTRRDLTETKDTDDLTRIRERMESGHFLPHLAH